MFAIIITDIAHGNYIDVKNKVVKLLLLHCKNLNLLKRY